jgi:phage terminase large subunit-like protein
MEGKKQATNQDLEVYKKIKKRLNYKKVAKLLNFNPHPYQEEILNIAQEGNFEVLVALLPRRAGKSTTMSVLAAGELLVPFASVLLITPTFQNAKAIFDKVERYIKTLNLPVKTRDSKSLTFTLENEAKFMVVSQKNYENALGQYFTMVIVDETGSIDNIQTIWETYINPAQTDLGLNENGYMWSKTYFIGTARSYDTDFYKLYEKAKKGVHGYKLIEATIYDNPLMTPKMIESLKAKVDKRTWEQEYLCKWQSSGSGELVFYAFEEEKNTLPLTEIQKMIDRNNTYIVGLDWGHTDNTAFVIACVLPMSGKIIVLDEYAENHLPLRIHTENFRAKERLWTDRDPIRYGDPSGSQIISELAYEYNYFVLPAPTALEEPIRKINQKFASGDLIICSDTCPNLIKELKTVQWVDKNKKQIARNSKDAHYDLAIGALRYMISGWESANQLTIQTLEY